MAQPIRYREEFELQCQMCRDWGVEVLMDARAQLVLQRLRNGPADTVTLQRSPIVHVAKNILDLPRAGYLITTTRQRNGTALYRLVSEPDVPVEAGRYVTGTSPATRVVAPSAAPGGPASSRAPRTVPEFGDLAAIRAYRR